MLTTTPLVYLYLKSRVVLFTTILCFRDTCVCYEIYQNFSSKQALEYLQRDLAFTLDKLGHEHVDVARSQSW